MPVYAALFVIVTMSSIGLPGTNGFVGEFMILTGTFMSEHLGTNGPIVATVAATRRDPGGGLHAARGAEDVLGPARQPREPGPAPT